MVAFARLRLWARGSEHDGHEHRFTIGHFYGGDS